MRAGIGGSMDPTESGVSSGWGGTRTTKEFVAKFPANLGGIVVAPNFDMIHSAIYAPGEYQDWAIGDDVSKLNSVAGDKIYEGHKYFPEDDMQFFITQYPGSPNLGDSDGDGTLTMGDTITAGAAGLYYIQVDLNANTYVMERRDWGVIGDATPTGWDSDTDMVWDAENQLLRLEIDLNPGNIKFRANDDWAANLGDDNGDAILTQEGADIPILEGGNYEILLYLNRTNYTYQLKNTSTDVRGSFYADGQTLEITDLTLFTEGYAINKFKNVNQDGSPGSNPDHVDTDFPVFRLADIYLMAAEAILRSNGNKTTALDYFNAVRFRAFNNSSAGHVTEDELTLDMILDERARELYWECHRRTDLIRFGQFTDGDYIWAWKGGIMEGKTVESYRDIFPIPNNDLGANPNLEQNPGYN
jgi:hypothetical protein